MPQVSAIEISGTVCFVLALIHTFMVGRFQKLANRFPSGSIPENLFHLLGEVEVTFGLWAAVFLLFFASVDGPEAATDYLNSRHFTEAAFVFVIMAVCSTRPILEFARAAIAFFARALPLPRQMASYITITILGPLLGSFITEPAAMTVTALLLIDTVFKRSHSLKLKYATIGLIFVNVSIGGTLTPYAAPPVLMVAGKWNWDLAFMLQNFGWKAILCCALSSVLTAFMFRKELLALPEIEKEKGANKRLPLWVAVLHFVFLLAIVVTHKHITVFLGIFLFFMGLYNVTREYQHSMRLREGLLVGFFLGGLVILGEPQTWWLEPVIMSLDSLQLYLGAIALTSITDNAALTFLGSQISGLSEVSRYGLVAGSVVGGGLTVIANAPNPAGYGLLNSYFGKNGIQPLWLTVAAIPFTVIAALIFWFL